MARDEGGGDTGDGRTARAQRRREERRGRILEAAGKVFGTRGYHSASIADVIAEAGISRGTFYLYFDSKYALFHELVQGFAARLIGAVEVVDPHGPDPQARLYENVQRLVDLFFENRYLTVLLFREAPGLDEEVDRTLRRLHDFWHEMMVGALANGAAWGITRKVNEPIVATAIIGSLKEVLYQYLVLDRGEDADPHAVAAALFDYFVRGLLP